MNHKRAKVKAEPAYAVRRKYFYAKQATSPVFRKLKLLLINGWRAKTQMKEIRKFRPCAIIGYEILKIIV